MRIKTKIKKITAAVLSAAVLLALTASLTGCRKDERGERGNMVDWSYDDLVKGDVYAEIRVRGYEGVMRFVLFEEIAPLGVAAFIAAAESGYYVNRSFHRVLEDILIQGGAFNLDGTDIAVSNDNKFVVEPHDNARNFFGALAFAVDEHSGANYRQFFIVTANTPVDVTKELESMSVAIGRLKELTNPTPEESAELRSLEVLYERLSGMSSDAKKRYQSVGGYFLLDGAVTVFGQILDGHEMLLEIAGTDVVGGNVSDDNNPGLGTGGRGRPSRPVEPILIESITIVRVTGSADAEEE
jgi:cyclophilin family peptidyl-prolyl cis-trans isomerase